jgi:DNA-binding NtrC family response regulator
MDILIIDDDFLTAQTMAQQLTAMGFHVDVGHDGNSGHKLWQAKEYGLVLLDLALPDITGLELLEKWQTADGQRQGSPTPVIIISGTGTIPQAVQAMKLGALDFLVKPVEMTLLEAVVQRTIQQSTMRRDNERLRVLSRGDTIEFLGSSAAVNELLAQAGKIAKGDHPVMIEGETGTGKQVLARWIHAQSERARESFVSVNCAAITETLFESELFGHEKGAFTGAVGRKPGKLELAGKGTIFLDEIGELPSACQAKLLTAVEDRVFERVGGVQTLKFEGRVLAATNRNLDEEVAAGHFRRDMFFRLSAFRLKLPPLRERPEDVPVYVDWTLGRLRRQLGKPFEGPDAQTLNQLQKYSWPGNVRELIHHVERVAVLSDTPRIPRALWLSFPQGSEEGAKAEEEDLRAALDAYKRQHILRIVARCGGNQTEAARHLGIERTHLNRLLAEYEGRR